MQPEEQRLADRLDELNKAVRAWGALTRKQLLRRLAELGVREKVILAREASYKKKVNLSIRGEDILMRSMKHGLKKQAGALDHAWFSFARQGIFIEHGVGKTRPVRSTQALEAAKPWLTVVLPHRVEELADLLTNHYADIAAAELRILIPGIIDTKITTG